ncbi:MAG: dCTP deaminase [Candidatus Heimdallarchaeota archaeon]|nr:MAG: dCTP deaminase [Candidatus Heimdallarchaeota archaeon]
MKYSLFNGWTQMRFLKTNELEESWKSLIYSPKQLGDVTLDLTVKKIFTFKNQGALDFGGSEYQPVVQEPLLPKIEDDPKYGWWTLSAGMYIIEYNENLSGNECLAIIYPNKRLLGTGCFHPVFIVDPSKNSQSIQGLLSVNSQSVRIKENARISTALTFRTD